ncbi:Rrf2 family transcriptional regulator [Oceanibaculum indicum]|uniref:Rrf2 family nitric oxide-sensitive transcriptional repressor n=1 Tax=Oceanibaculum indicum TaxID=526216 RepID=A0A420WMW8_9PROT|nr:Rrf2 family transcriptional regulator [Oceanibaculum indicum]RKQ72329.1 Rrf2 family nitric oxide-sensitive transcriptional repressor [Oceanibaculum indicum]
MRLTVHTDYALRMLIHLGLLEGRTGTIDAVAEAYGISRNHLMKVAHRLGREGFVETIRGRGGGLRLARPATEIRIGDVVRATEEDFALVECFPPLSRACAITPACTLRHVFAEALDAYFAVLDRSTLADLLENRPQLAALLRIAI